MACFKSFQIHTKWQKDIKDFCRRCIASGRASTMDEALQVPYLKSERQVTANNQGYYVVECNPMYYGPDQCTNFTFDPRPSLHL